MPGVRVLSVGSALPSIVLSNAMLAEALDTEEEWIVERTGIRERRVGGSTTDLAARAAATAIGHAGLEPEMIDLLILATSTSGQVMPAGAALVARKLGLSCGFFDLDATCAGFAYGVIVGAAMTRAHARHTLLIGADTMADLVNPNDRATAVLFGDGAGAMVLGATDGGDHLLSSHFGSDPTAAHLLYASHDGFIEMRGKEVFRRAIQAAVDSIMVALERAGVGPEEVALFVPHQANARLIEVLAARVGIPESRTAIAMEKTGNTSAASIPIALDDAARSGRVQPGDVVLLCGFGSGLTWASAILRW